MKRRKQIMSQAELEQAIERLKSPLGQIMAKIALTGGGVVGSSFFHRERRQHLKHIATLPRNKQPMDASYWHNKSIGHESEEFCKEFQKISKRWLKRIQSGWDLDQPSQLQLAEELEREFNNFQAKYGRGRMGAVV